MSTPLKIVVIGGGIAGLCSALWLGSRGHHVTVLERDDAPLPPTVDEAWHTWDRRGAPQVRQPHVVLGRLCTLLRSHHPAVYDALVKAGATEATFTDLLTPDSADYQPEPGDDQLTSVRIRRVTLEWVLRKAVLAHDHVTFCSGTAVGGLVAEPGPIPHVTGVRLTDGSVLDADFVVAASGKRSHLDDWYTEIGAQKMPEESGESGLVYISRFYRLPEGREFDRESPTIITHGYLQGGVFEADNRTFSVSVCLPKDDIELRKLFLKPGNLERVLHELPQYSSIADSTSEPISDIGVMAGVTNLWRDMVVDGQPLVTGLVPVGDALMTTNPTYGRGMSIAAWTVDMMARALDQHADDPVGLVQAYAEEALRELKPWYEVSRDMDLANRLNAEAVLAGEPAPSQTTEFTRIVALIRYDAIVQRAFLRSTYLLAAPTAMLQDLDVLQRLASLNERYPDAGLAGGKPAERGDLIAMLADGSGSADTDAAA